jgi:uncharacterized repeat protein (TIGR04076 family)
MRAKRAHTVEIRVVSQRGTCAAGHKVGEVFRILGESERFQTPGICLHALATMLPKILALRYGAAFPWAEEGGAIRHACPDPVNPCVFELRAVG